MSKSNHRPCGTLGIEHCYHEIMRSTLHAGIQKNQTITEQCCWCGNIEVRKYETGRSPDHGPHAPPILVPVAKR